MLFYIEYSMFETIGLLLFIAEDATIIEIVHATRQTMNYGLIDAMISNFVLNSKHSTHSFCNFHEYI